MKGSNPAYISHVKNHSDITSPLLFLSFHGSLFNFGLDILELLWKLIHLSSFLWQELMDFLLHSSSLGKDTPSKCNKYAEK